MDVFVEQSKELLNGTQSKCLVVTCQTGFENCISALALAYYLQYRQSRGDFDFEVFIPVLFDNEDGLGWDTETNFYLGKYGINPAILPFWCDINFEGNIDGIILIDYYTSSDYIHDVDTDLICGIFYLDLIPEIEIAFPHGHRLQKIKGPAPCITSVVANYIIQQLSPFLCITDDEKWSLKMLHDAIILNTHGSRGNHLSFDNEIEAKIRTVLQIPDNKKYKDNLLKEMSIAHKDHSNLTALQICFKYGLCRTENFVCVEFPEGLDIKRFIAKPHYHEDVKDFCARFQIKTLIISAFEVDERKVKHQLMGLINIEENEFTKILMEQWLRRPQSRLTYRGRFPHLAGKWYRVNESFFKWLRRDFTM